MAVKFSNNARTNLSSSILSTATSIVVDDATVFPTLGAGDITYVTLESLDNSPTREIVKVTAINTSTDTLTVVRGQDDTTAAAFSSGAKVELRVTAALLNAVADDADTESVSISGDTMTGNLTIASTTLNVGNGTVADPMVLIDSASGGDPVLRFDTGAASRQSFIDFFDQGTMSGSIYYNHSDDTLDIAVASNNRTSKMSLDGSGNATFAGTITAGNITSAGAGDIIIEDTGGGSAHLRLKSSASGTTTSHWKLKTNAANSFFIDNDQQGTSPFTIDSSDNATFAGTISSGAITSTGNSAFGKIAVGTDNDNAWSTLWVERDGINLANEWSYEDASNPAHLTLAGANSHVRMLMGTMDTTPYGVYIQGTYDNTPDNSGTGSSGTEPIHLNPMGGNVSIGSYDASSYTLDVTGTLGVSSTVTWSGGSSTNANTAYTYSQVGHLPLAGGTLTGSLTGTSATFTGAIDGTSISVDAGTTLGVRVHSNSGITASNNYLNFFTSQTNGWAFNANGTGADSDSVASITSAGAATFSGNGTFNGGTLTVSSGTSGDALLIIEADTDNNAEGDLPSIQLKADGGIIEGTIRLNDNTLDIINNVSSGGGIRFLTGTTNNYGTTDPANEATTALTIDSSQDATFAGTITSGAITSTGVFNSYTAIGASDNVRTGVAHYDTTAMASGVGGQLVLGYKYDTGGTYTEGAILKMYKENATSGQYGSGLKFQVRNHGDNLSTKMTLNPSGDLSVTGSITAKNATITDDGSSSPLLKISADDNGPWAIQLYREDLGGGPQVFASNTTTWSFQGHIDLRSGYGYYINTVNVIDSNRNADFASLKQGSYVRIKTGESNTGQITFNANWDGSGYVPDYAGASYAGMTVLKMPAGGEGGLQVYTKNSGTTSTSQALSTFTKVADFHSGGYFDASNGLRVGGTQVFDTSQQITANGSRFRTVTTSNSPSGSNIDIYIQPDTSSGDHTWRVISGGDNTGYGVGEGGLGFYYNNNSEYNLILKPDMSAVFGNQVSINHGVLSSEPYSGLVVTNTATSGAAFTGITADAKFQTHYRYKINGALKWQTRVGNGNGTDDWRLYSWTSARDILTVKPSGEGQFRFFKDSSTQYSDTGSNTGSIAISGYGGQGGASNPNITMSANVGGWAMFYMNRIYNGQSIGFDNGDARYFDFYRDGSSKVRIVNSSSDQFGFYQVGGNSFNVWNSGATQTFQVSNGGVVSIPAGTLQVKGTWIGRSNTAGHFYVGNNDWTDLLTSTNVSGFDPNDWVYNATNKGITCTNSNWVRVKVSMPIDPDASYRVRVRVTKHSGSGTFYCAAVTLNENLTELSSDTATSYNYGVASGQSPGTNSTYQAIFSGYNATNTGTTTKFDPEGKYFDIVLICNYGGTGSTTIHSLEVERLPENLITNDISKKTTGTPITINSGQDASKGLRVYYDMDVYNSIHFTNSSYVSQGYISGSDNNLAYKSETHDFYTGSAKNALGFRLYQANATWDVANVYSTYSTGAGLSLDATGTSAGSKWSIISQGSSGGAGQDNLGFHLTTARSGSGYSTGYKAYLDNSGFRINGTLSATGGTIDGGSSTTFQVICDDDGVATIRAMGEGQGTGRLFVGQSSEYGGGVEYNGDNSPASTGAGADYITLYRVEAGSYYWTARNYYNSNDWSFRGNVTAYASDERLKENITPITDALSKVKSLRGVQFDWKDECEELGFIPTMKHETGVIAQDVQAVIPDAAVPAPFNEEYLTVKHEKIIPLLIEAIKEQQSIIETLTKRLEKIENDDDKND